MLAFVKSNIRRTQGFRYQFTPTVHVVSTPPLTVPSVRSSRSMRAASSMAPLQQQSRSRKLQQGFVPPQSAFFQSYWRASPVKNQPASTYQAVNVGSPSVGASSFTHVYSD